MNKIGFLGCSILQDEMIYLIEKDPSIKKVTLIKNGEEESISKKFREQGISFEEKYLEQLDLKEAKSESDEIEIVVWILELGLHEFPKVLKQTVYENVDSFSKHVNGILIFYGLCGNVLGKIDEDLSTDDCVVRILRESNGDVVDDCIGATVNGRANYLSLLKSFKGVGTFIFTPMFSATTGEFFEYKKAKMNLSEEEILEMNRFMFRECRYKYVAKLDTGLYYTSDVDSMNEEFANKYDFEVIDLDSDVMDLDPEGGYQILFNNNYNFIKDAIKEV